MDEPEHRALDEAYDIVNDCQAIYEFDSEIEFSKSTQVTSVIRVFFTDADDVDNFTQDITNLIYRYQAKGSINHFSRREAPNVIKRLLKVLKPVIWRKKRLDKK